MLLLKTRRYISILRSLWIISSILLYFSAVDVRSESGPVWVNVWPGDAT